MFERLALASFAWFAIHAFVAGSELRWWLVQRIGQRAFSVFFSLLSLTTLLFLVDTYRKAQFYPLWFPPRVIHFLPLLVMPFSLTLLVGAFSVPNPTAVGAEKVLERTDAARGVLRITRHPFLWAVTLWSGAHLLVTGHVAAILFFGSLLLTALRGTSSIDEKRRRTNKAEFTRYLAVTSNVPFAAIIQGKNRFVLKELWVPLVIAALLMAVLLHVHLSLFGRSPFG
ncbi:MAG TPA: NnrU family protein [Polyangiaceae bacterium]|nr:NnrU family protein [Polyangiaceae bacterium]